jgi:CheY-like chemotaxis protein
MLMFGLMGTLTLGLTNTGHELYAEIISWADPTVGHAEAAPPARSQVLLMSRNRADQFLVDRTVAPRGYEVVMAYTAASANEILRTGASQVAAVVLDTEIPGAESVVATAHAMAPVARVIRLPPIHAAIDVSKPLIDGI